jgi:stearoyl-CoA desaturase (delta-9 desaturase)
MAWIPFFAAGVVNGVAHYFGYRNFESKDNSRNFGPWGFFIGGEELHNNHHAFATSAKFSVKWWEFDIGWMMIRILQFFRLAKPKRVVPRLGIAQHKKQIDTDTLKALISHRLQVTARYTREVILPLLSEEKKRAGKAGQQYLSRARTLLIRDVSIMKTTQQARLRQVLDNFHNLRIVYQFRVRLQEIWGRSTASQKELLEALQEWCQQAEETGIEALRHFADRLKTYVPHEAR